MFGETIAELDAAIDDDILNGNELLLGGTGVFYEKYTGDLSASDVTTALKKINKNHIPRIYKLIKDYNTAELEKFFDNNAKNIENMVGITNKEDFVKFSKELQKVNTDFGRCSTLDAIKETFLDESDKEGYAYIEYIVTYKDKKEVKFYIYVARSEFTTPLYIVGIID